MVTGGRFYVRWGNYSWVHRWNGVRSSWPSVKVQDLDGATCTLLVLEQVVRVQGDVLLKGLGLR